MDTYLPPWREHYRYMPNTDDVDGLFEERVNELRLDREFSRVVVRYNKASDWAIDTWFDDHTVVRFESANEVKPHPDTFIAKWSWPRQYPGTSSGEISEDVRILGEAGAAVIAEVDPCLSKYHATMGVLYDECKQALTKLHSVMHFSDVDMKDFLPAFNKISKCCREVYRRSIEDYIQSNPEVTADDIISTLEHRKSATIRLANKFKNRVNDTVTKAIDGFIYCSDREAILSEYDTVKRELSKTPIKSFLSAARGEYATRYNSTYHCWRFNDKSDSIQKLYQTAWAIEMNGFSKIDYKCWPYPIMDISEFVVIVHQFITRKGTDKTMRATQHFNGVTDAFTVANGLTGLFGTIRSTYLSYRDREESGVESAYEEYNDFVSRSIDGPQIGSKPMSEYIFDSISVIRDQGNKLMKTMKMLDKGYAFNKAMAARSGRSASLNAEVSPLDYEENIRNAVQLILCNTETCIDDENDDREIAFTKFNITDETRSDGVGLCLVLKCMKSYADRIVVADKTISDGSHWIIKHNHCNVLYRTLREIPFDENLDVKGIIFWNTTKTPMFINQLQKAYGMK